MKTLNRVFALLLVPCLLADPGLAVGVSRTVYHAPHGIFAEQAFSNKTLWGIHPWAKALAFESRRQGRDYAMQAAGRQSRIETWEDHEELIDTPIRDAHANQNGKSAETLKVQDPAITPVLLFLEKLKNRGYFRSGTEDFGGDITKIFQELAQGRIHRVIYHKQDEALPVLGHASDRGIHLFMHGNKRLSTEEEAAVILHEFLAYMGQSHLTAVGFEVLFRGWQKSNRLLNPNELQMDLEEKLWVEKWHPDVIAHIDLHAVLQNGFTALRGYLKAHPNREPDLLKTLSGLEKDRESQLDALVKELGNLLVRNIDVIEKIDRIRLGADSRCEYRFENSKDYRIANPLLFDRDTQSIMHLTRTAYISMIPEVVFSNSRQLTEVFILLPDILGALRYKLTEDPDSIIGFHYRDLFVTGQITIVNGEDRMEMSVLPKDWEEYLDRRGRPVIIMSQDDIQIHALRRDYAELRELPTPETIIHPIEALYAQGRYQDVINAWSQLKIENLGHRVYLLFAVVPFVCAALEALKIPDEKSGADMSPLFNWLENNRRKVIGSIDQQLSGSDAVWARLGLGITFTVASNTHVANRKFEEAFERAEAGLKALPEESAIISLPDHEDLLKWRFENEARLAAGISDIAETLFKTTGDHVWLTPVAVNYARCAAALDRLHEPKASQFFVTAAIQWLQLIPFKPLKERNELMTRAEDLLRQSGPLGNHPTAARLGAEGLLATYQDQLDKAEGYLAKSVEMDPEKFFMGALARVYWLQGHLEKAAEVADAQLKMDTVEAYERGRIHFELGNKNEARRAAEYGKAGGIWLNLQDPKILRAVILMGEGVLFHRDFLKVCLALKEWEQAAPLAAWLLRQEEVPTADVLAMIQKDNLNPASEKVLLAKIQKLTTDKNRREAIQARVAELEASKSAKKPQGDISLEELARQIWLPEFASIFKAVETIESALEEDVWMIHDDLVKLLRRVGRTERPALAPNLRKSLGPLRQLNRERQAKYRRQREYALRNEIEQRLKDYASRLALFEQNVDGVLDTREQLYPWELFRESLSVLLIGIPPWLGDQFADRIRLFTIRLARLTESIDRSRTERDAKTTEWDQTLVDLQNIRSRDHKNAFISARIRLQTLTAQNRWPTYFKTHRERAEMELRRAELRANPVIHSLRRPATAPTPRLGQTQQRPHAAPPPVSAERRVSRPGQPTAPEIRVEVPVEVPLAPAIPVRAGISVTQELIDAVWPKQSDPLQPDALRPDMVWSLEAPPEEATVKSAVFSTLQILEENLEYLIVTRNGDPTPLSWQENYAEGDQLLVDLTTKTKKDLFPHLFTLLIGPFLLLPNAWIQHGTDWLLHQPWLSGGLAMTAALSILKRYA